MNSKITYLDNGCIVQGTFYSIADLRDLYCVQNISQYDMASLFGVGRSTIIELFRRFNISKDSEQAKVNRKQGLLKKYGVDSAMKVPEIAKKSHEILCQKYGDKGPLGNAEVRQKSKETMLSRYGVQFPSQSPDIISEKQQKYKQVYGVDNHWQLHINHYDIWSDPARLEQYLRQLSQKPTYAELAEFFNVDRTGINAKILKLNLTKYIDIRPAYSKYEKEVVDYLKSTCGLTDCDIQCNVRGLLPNPTQEIDIYIPSKKIGIEFNGDYWHCDLFYNDHGGRSTYHQDKSLGAERVGIFLFHIFEYEWLLPEKRANILNRLCTLFGYNQIKIPARKCLVVELTRAQKKNFLSQYHIQGNDRSAKYFGLEYNGEIVACMTFGRSKFVGYDWELSRFCNKHNTIVQGGASKLFAYFISTLSPGSSIVSYNDITKTRGDIYRILGFQLKSVNQPNYVWINFHNHDIRSRYQEQKAGENARMVKAGYHRLCDCGTKTWVYNV